MPQAFAVPASARWAYEEVPYRKIGEPTLHWSYPGSPTELNLGIVNVTFLTNDAQPRHRHTFDQVRYVISGSMTYGRGKTAEAGDLVYFPEGLHYGPISYQEGEFFLIQWKGPSDVGVFIGYEELRAVAKELAARGGTFDNDEGLFRHSDGRVQDGYESIAEFVSGRRVQYATPRYADQVAVRSRNVSATDVPGAPGVRIKHLGYFNDVGPNVKQLEFDTGAELPARRSQSQQIWTVVSGQVTYEGDSYAERALIYASPGSERAAVRAEQPTTMLVVHIRGLDGSPMPFSEF